MRLMRQISKRSRQSDKGEESHLVKENDWRFQFQTEGEFEKLKERARSLPIPLSSLYWVAVLVNAALFPLELWRLRCFFLGGGQLSLHLGPFSQSGQEHSIKSLVHSNQKQPETSTLAVIKAWAVILNLPP